MNPYAPPGAEPEPPKVGRGERQRGVALTIFVIVVGLGAAVSLVSIAIGRTTFETPTRTVIGTLTASVRLASLVAIFQRKWWGAGACALTQLAYSYLAATDGKPVPVVLGVLVAYWAILVWLVYRKRRYFS